MPPFARAMLALGGALLALATALGAIESHALAARLPAQQLAVFDTALRYHFFHALGLIALGSLARSGALPLQRLAGWLIAGGIVLFSGSLYLLTAGAAHIIGVLTPLGGLALIAGWALFAFGVWRTGPAERA